MLTNNDIDKVKKILQTKLSPSETFIDLIEVSLASNQGILILTDKKLFFITVDEKVYTEFTFDDIIFYEIEKKETGIHLVLSYKSEPHTMRIYNNEAAIEQFINYLSGFVTIYEPKEEPTADEIEELANINFLYLEAKKIYLILSNYQLLFDVSLHSVLIDDLIRLATICTRHKKKIRNEERFFITLTIVPLHPGIPRHVKQGFIKILNGDFFNAENINYIINNWNLIADYITTNTDAPLSSFKILELTKKIDIISGTTYHDKIRTILFNFMQCIIKANGYISNTEIDIIKTINTIIYHKDPSSHRVQTGNIDTTTIKPPKASEEEEKQVNAPEEEPEDLETIQKKINALIGMENIKKEVNTLINLIKIQKEREARGLTKSSVSLHAVFYGPPGTGKTTIARYMGKVYKSLGLLKKGHLIETDRAGLVAGYVGQTAIKVDEVINKALDGVLFIDEAYALKPADSKSDFGQEAIDTILKRMEDYRDRLVIIVAGYPDEMKDFINSNPGLKSRFNRYFYFNDYEPGELLKIFLLFCDAANLKVTNEAEEKMLVLLTEFYENRDRTFGNGRLARNIFEKIIERQSNRLVNITPLTDELLSTFTQEDIPEKSDIEI